MKSMLTYLKSKLSHRLKNRIVSFKKEIINFLSDVYLGIRFSLRRQKKFASVPCIVPFTRLEFDISGNVTACCPPFTKVKFVGEINNKTIEQIWNGKEMRRFRKHLFMEQTKKTCKSNCPFLYGPPIFLKNICTETNEGRLLYDDISYGRVKLRSHPLWFNLANYAACNLNCDMCRSRNLDCSYIPKHVKKTHEEINKYFDKRITLFLAGNGDVLARRDTRKLLQNFDNKKYSKVTFELLTNGLLFQPHMWETIKHNDFVYANISIDAATKETYEKLRRGGKWEQLMKALEVFKKAKEEGKFRSVNINMTVMKSNFREIPQFVEMARVRGFKSYFSILRGQAGDENFFEANDVGTLKELKTVLNDPKLYGEDVDMLQLIKYVPKEYRSQINNHNTTIWLFPSFLFK